MNPWRLFRRNIPVCGNVTRNHKTKRGDILRLVQFTDRSGARRVAASEDGKNLRVLAGVTRTYDLALAAARANSSLESAAKAKIGAESVSSDSSF